jgi:hypothetical protein
MTPMETCPPYEPAQHERNFSPARLECVERKDGIETVYLHSASRGASAQEKAGGRQGPHTSLVLTPKFTPGDEVTYVLKFVWADSSGPAAGKNFLNTLRRDAILTDRRIRASAGRVKKVRMRRFLDIQGGSMKTFLWQNPLRAVRRSPLRPAPGRS